MNIKNVFKSLAFAMLMPAMLFTTSCGNEDEAIIGGGDAKLSKTIPVTVNVTRQSDKAATRAEYDGITKKLGFSTGDKLFVNGYTDDVSFVGILTWVSGSKFTGDLDIYGTYSGTVEEMFTEASDGSHNIFAILLPNGYETYGFLSIVDEGVNRNVLTSYPKAVAPDLATAVEQFSLEYADTYSDGFALAPHNAIVYCSYKSASTIAEGTACKPYLHNDFWGDYGDDVEIQFGKRDIVNFAIAIYADPGFSDWIIKDYSSIIPDINLGTKAIPGGHIYNVKNYTLSSLTVTDPNSFVDGNPKTIYYVEGETWREAIENHPIENRGWIFYFNDINYYPTFTGYTDEGTVWDEDDGDWPLDNTVIDGSHSYSFC